MSQPTLTGKKGQHPLCSKLLVHSARDIYTLRPCSHWLWLLSVPLRTQAAYIEVVSASYVSTPLAPILAGILPPIPSPFLL